MLNSKKVILSLGSNQMVFQSGGTYTKEQCKAIETIVSCDSVVISANGGVAMLTIVEDESMVTMKITNGNSKLSDENKVILYMHCGKEFNMQSYYGLHAIVDFVNTTGNYGNDINTIKAFFESWVVSEGDMSYPILVISDDILFNAVMKDNYFEKFIVLKEI